MQICTCAGEVSGDQILAPFIQKLKLKQSIYASGIAGPDMIKQGTFPLFQMERLSVMGIMEILPRLPELVAMRQQMKRYLMISQPRALLTCDAPDFNLALCGYAKRLSIPAFHIVSPSVWAWRAKRIPKIAQQLDGLLCLFPFEPELYKGTGLKTKFIGHPLASTIKFNPDRRYSREILNLSTSDPILAILPGSRIFEVRKLLAVFLNALDLLCKRIPNLSAVIPVATDKLMSHIQDFIGSRPVTLVKGQSKEVIAASDAVLLASGTAALEACLTGRPTVAAYRLNSATYFLIKRKLTTSFVTLPNFMANQALIPELIQGQATIANIVDKLEPLLLNGASEQFLRETKAIHENLIGPEIDCVCNWLLNQWL